MKYSAEFAYAQARMQARHGQRPGDEVWQQLQGSGDLASFLLVVRRTTLRDWVLSMNIRSSIHEIEQSLRDQFRAYVDEVAAWQPVDWGDSVRWIRCLVDLPALQHLLSGSAAPGWILNDPILRDFASEEKERRLEAIMLSDYSHLAEAWLKGQSLPHAWLEHWLHVVPANAMKETGIKQVALLYRETFLASAVSASPVTEQQRFTLHRRLTKLFRRYSFQAAAAYAHIGLVALDLEKLRRGLVRRALFPELMKAAS